jgi:hypothetical protein
MHQHRSEHTCSEPSDSKNSEQQRGFFAINSRVWPAVCDIGLNAAASYLILACGTGRDNRSTNWSAQALHKYGGITWERGKAAIESLIRNEFLGKAQGSTHQKPRYELLFPAISDEKRDDADPIIWLPNSIVTGTPARETPPVHRLRSAGDVLTLRLFIEMYHAHNLLADGGISPRLVRERYDRLEVGENGAYDIVGFKLKRREIFWTGIFAPHKSSSVVSEDHPVRRSIKLLESMGLLSFVPHLFENDSVEAEIHHPYGVGAKGELKLESEIGCMADSAARALCTEWLIEEAENDGFEHFCPVIKTVPNLQMVGIARLRYRPHTRRTSAWIAQLQRHGAIWIESYRQIEAQATSSQAKRCATAADTRWLRDLG